MKKTMKLQQTLKHKILFFAGAALLLLLAGCTVNKAVSDSNLSEMYRSSDEFLEPDFIVYHRSNDSSTVFFRFNTKNLLYARKLNAKNPTARVRLGYRLYQDFESNALLDSGSVVLTDPVKTEIPKWVTGSFRIPVKRGNNYILRLQATDMNRGQHAHSVQPVLKESVKGRHEYLLMDSVGRPLFRPYIGPGERITVQYSQAEQSRVIHGKFYNRSFPVAPPPFAAFTPKPFDYVPDSTFTMALTDSATFTFRSTQEGFFHLTIQEDDRDGLTLYRFDSGFPEVNTLSEMVSALRFVTSKKEYFKIADAPDQKVAMDAFWLSASNNPDRARELIKAYFNRVQNANLYFSSYKEGWKTDRGIIYIVFGPPNTVYKSNDSESWLYGEEGNYLSVAFNFARVKNPFTPNDFVLQRSPTYKTQWYRAVDAWRQGRVSTLDF